MADTLAQLDALSLLTASQQEALCLIEIVSVMWAKHRRCHHF